MDNVSKRKFADQGAITEDVFREYYQFKGEEVVPLKKKIKQKLAFSETFFFDYFPILKWLPSYSIKEYLIADIVAGMTVAVMHIPHGLAYAPLGGVQPVVGLYMSVFPTIVYLLMGTSRHISLGTFAVLCMMVGQVVSKHSIEDFLKEQENSTFTRDMEMSGKYPAIEVGVAVCLIVGLWQLLLGLLHLGSLSVLLSSSLVSGFTTGAAVHVTTYQLKNLLGVEVRTFSGPLKLFYTFVDLFRKVGNTNLVTLGISVCCICVLLLFNEVLKPKIQKACTRCRIPVPIELIVIVGGVLASYFLELDKTQNVKIVNFIPKGMPEPMVPPFELLPKLIIDGFVVAIVGISISLSLASIFANKSGYTISGNQELLAYGVGNTFGSFFMCLPVAASLSRSLVQHAVGGKTLMANLFTIILIILILLFMGPLFEPVPYAVLSSIVVVTLKGLLMQVTDFPKMYRKSQLDGLVWMATFGSVVIIDLDYGLGIGIMVSVATMLMRSQTPQIVELGQVPDTNMFLDIRHYKVAQKIDGIVMLQIIGGLHFANCQKLQNRLLKYSQSSPEAIILNLISVPYIDPTAVNTLSLLYKDLEKKNCRLYLSDCTITVYETLQHCEFFKVFPQNQVLASLFDAVEFLQQPSSKAAETV